MQRQRERQQNAIVDAPSGAVQGSQEAPKIEAKTSNLDAVKSRLDSMREEAIGRGDFDLVTKINKAVRTNNVEAMRKLAGPTEATPVETTQAPNVIAPPTQNVVSQETTATQKQMVSTTQNAEPQSTPNLRTTTQGQISPAETIEAPSIPQRVTQPEASREQIPTEERRYKMAEPSRERRMQNESAETTTTETPVTAQNQDQYAQPGQAEQEAQEVAPENNERPVDDAQEIHSQNAPRPAGEAIGEEGNQVLTSRKRP